MNGVFIPAQHGMKNHQKVSKKSWLWHPHCKVRVLIYFSSPKPTAATKWQHPSRNPKPSHCQVLKRIGQHLANKAYQKFVSTPMCIKDSICNNNVLQGDCITSLLGPFFLELDSNLLFMFANCNIVFRSWINFENLWFRVGTWKFGGGRGVGNVRRYNVQGGDSTWDCMRPSWLWKCLELRVAVA